MTRLVILGNGIAGITAARFARKRDASARITVVSGETDHFFSRTALMYIYMGHMRYEHTKPYEDRFWDENRIELRRAWVERVDFEGKALHTSEGTVIEYDTLLLATGSTSNRFGWPGQDLVGVQGLYSIQDLESMESHTVGLERAVVVGGGLIGIEMVEMLRTRDIPVTFLVRESQWMQRVTPPEESAAIAREIRRHGVDLRLETELERIEGDAAGRVRAVVTTDGEEIPCGFVGLTVGVSPRIELFQDSPLETDRGILVDEFLRTNQPDVYAAGDCVQLRAAAEGRRPVEPLWYTGRQMGQTVAAGLVGEEPARYVQGFWFNSAKFFHLEWQTYGVVGAEPREGEETLFWKSDDDKVLVRINYRSSDLAVVGFNLLGVRYRQEACQRFIEEERPLPWVLENLGAANFDPEFYAQPERHLIEAWNASGRGQPAKAASKRSLRHWLRLRRAS